MQLFEFFDSLDSGVRHLTDQDATAYDLNNDTRKSRLTLEMINQLRQSIQQRRKEQREDRELYQKMYGGSVADSAEPTL
jgi:hypothetical protein|tara:strand:- start:229 stop:465 length:237 start_codon:yes stop_codon:yes gene_type:complete